MPVSFLLCMYFLVALGAGVGMACSDSGDKLKIPIIVLLAIVWPFSLSMEIFFRLYSEDQMEV